MLVRCERELRPLVRRGVVLAGITLVVLGAAGCRKALLSPTEERTPFDRWDSVRGQAAPQQVEDELGRTVPNLRGRLEPRE